MKTDTQLQHDVMAELEWEPSLTASQICVSAKDGVVTLSGSVPRYADKMTAESVARRAGVVKGVANDIEVRIAGSNERTDADIAAAASQGLWDFSSNFVQGSPHPDVEDTVESALPKTVADVFHSYSPRVYRLARSILSNEADAEDVTQAVFLQVVRELDTFRGDCDLTTWLHRITVNAALQHRRKQTRRPERQMSVPLEVLLNGEKYCCTCRPAAAPAEKVLQDDLNDLIDAAIAQLPDIYHDLYVLADIEGLSNEESSLQLGLTVPAIRAISVVFALRVRTTEITMNLGTRMPLFSPFRSLQ